MKRYGTLVLRLSFTSFFGDALLCARLENVRQGKMLWTLEVSHTHTHMHAINEYGNMDESRAVESLGPTEGSSGTSQRSIYRRPYTTNIIISIMVSQIIFIYVKNISTTRCLLRCALVCTAHVKHPCALCTVHTNDEHFRIRNEFYFFPLLAE